MYFSSKVIKMHNWPYSPHVIAPALVADKSSVLDIGCNAGYIGKFLKENKHCRCDGIDIDKVALRKAKPYYEHLYTFDLFNDRFVLKKKYDCLLFLDILEHLPTPSLILKKFVVKNLLPGGKAVICLPNIARFEFRIKHLFGKFEYQPGIMNEDHLRFFTKKTGRQMIENSGLEIINIIPTGLGAMIKILPTLTAFQFIYHCKKRS